MLPALVSNIKKKKKNVANQLHFFFFITKQTFSDSEHGFRRKSSTETILTVVGKKIYDMDKKYISLLTLCDLSKAFDGVSHKILLSKCAKLTVGNFWFENYSSNRTVSEGGVCVDVVRVPLTVWW